MAKLTDYSQTERRTPRVGEGGLPRTGAPQDETLSRGLQSLSGDVAAGLQEVYRSAKIEEDKVNTLRAEEAFTKLRDKQLDLSIGEQNGFTKLKGSAAVTKPLLKEYGSRFDDAEREAMAGLANDDQKLKFKQRADLARLQFNEDLLRHIGREGQVYAKEVYDGTVAGEQQQATARWDSPNDVAAAMVRIQNAVRTRAAENSWAPEYTKAVLQKEQGQVHASVIGQAVANGNYRYAQAWYEKNKEDIDPQTARVLHHAVQEGTQKELAAAYNSEYLANESNQGALKALHTRLLADKTLDEQRKNVLVGRTQNRIDVLQQREEMRQERGLRVLERQVGELNANTLAGVEPTAEQFAPVITAAKGTELEPMVNQAIALAAATRTFRTAPPVVQERILVEAEAGVRKEPGKFDRKVVSAWRQIYEAQKQQVQDNPTAFAMRQGIVEPLPQLELDKPASMGPALQQYFAVARGMVAKYQAPMKPLTTAQANLLSASLKQSSANEKRAYFAGLAQAAGEDYEGYSAIMGQIAPDDPVTAVAGQYAYRGREEAANLILKGQQVLNPLKKEDGKPDQGKLWPMPPDKDLRANWVAFERDAFAGHPGARNAMYQSALAIYAAKSVADGDATAVLNTGRWEEAMRMATGGIEKHKGRAILLPYGQEYGQFRDGLRARIDLLVESKRMAPKMDRATIEDLPLEAIGDGRYIFKAGDARLVDKDGRDVVIDFNVGLPYRASGIHLQELDREPTPQELEAARQPVTGRADKSAAGKRTPPGKADALARKPSK